MNLLRHYGVRAKLLALITIAVILMLFNAAFQANESYLTDIADRKVSMQEQVKAAISLVQYYSDKYPLDQHTAQQEAKSALSAMRFDGGNYFWVIATDNTLVMHPLRQQQEGQSMQAITDASGKQHWHEMTTIGRRSGSGFLDYAWIAPGGEVSEKISYVENFSKWGWVIGTGVHLMDIEDRFFDSLVFLLGVSLVTIFILVGLGLWISNDISQPLQQLTDRVRKLEQGDLTQNFTMDRHDEIGQIAQVLHQASSSLRMTLQAANLNAQQSASMAGTIAAASEQCAQSITEQNQQLAQLATAMEEMSATITDVAKNAETVSSSTSEINVQVDASNQRMVLAMAAIHSVSQGIEHSDQRVGELKGGVEEIGHVTQVIQGISEQTNLLALNAAIEAARAGEQGRGFAVVADEVRNLASRTQQSTIEIQDTIDKLTQSTLNTVKSMAESTEQTQYSVEHTEQVQNELNRIAGLVTEANDMIMQVATAAEQQGTVTEEVNNTVTLIYTATEDISKAAQHLASESHSLTEAAATLGDQLKKFKV
ncbi:methyl-accepting chemotaxis protein [Photobacterium lutimaris]|uniref:Methyl-accepting chemotaxis protein n=1 Tax=Photobacterium lutimaris TaxID=388278 RepID=A0A2T3IQA9_9GAMM|nr:methyl-accepting chemotaxis protein [Photobacterium lutimaris]PSU30512.1 methyl-accepting chemotaxis protein [Photobacterium lutimaris]TDR76077.1 methyl-accepting chemotaxis sensory transducer with Cache sensor [Photobacterium lutimaris]